MSSRKIIKRIVLLTAVSSLFVFMLCFFDNTSSNAGTVYVSNPKVTKLSRYGYRVSVTINNRNFSYIEFPTWSLYEGQDDLIWHKALISGNTAYYDVKVSEHKNQFGPYITHLYVWDSSHKNLQSMSITNGNNTTVPVPYEPMRVSVLNKHVYAVYNSFLTWNNADTKCKEMGGYLATITNQTENDHIKKLINGLDACNWWYIGGERDNSLSVGWKWTTFEKWSYTNWKQGEPNNGNDAALTVGANALWNDESKTSTDAGFISEVEQMEPVFSGNYCKHDYYIFDQNVPYAVAKEYCKVKGGYLTVIDDKNENDFLMRLVQTGSNNSYYIGLERKNNNWYTVLGDRATYFDWESGQPDNYQNNQWNARIKPSTKKWDDYIAADYSTSTGFIMEKGIPASKKSNTKKTISKLSKKIPRGKIKKIKKKSRGRVKIKWKKNKKYSGYILQICRKKKFKKKVMQRYFKKKQTSIVVPLKKHRKYYVRVRIYKKKKNTQFFGKWSKIKRIRT